MNTARPRARTRIPIMRVEGQGRHRTQAIEVIVVDGVTIGHVDHTHRLAGYLVGFKKILPIQQKNTEKRLISIVELVLSQPELFAN